MATTGKCKLIVNDLGRVTLATPNGDTIPGIVKDSIEVFQDSHMLQSGLKRVRIDVYIRDEEFGMPHQKDKTVF